MVDPSKLVRRAPTRPLFRLGEGPLYEPLVRARVGERFPAFATKEADFVLDLESVRSGKRDGA